jgi:hypothetical protein
MIEAQLFKQLLEEKVIERFGESIRLAGKPKANTSHLFRRF